VQGLPHLIFDRLQGIQQTALVILIRFILLLKGAAAHALRSRCTAKAQPVPGDV
jgi:hypothetical protein